VALILICFVSIIVVIVTDFISIPFEAFMVAQCFSFIMFIMVFQLAVMAFQLAVMA